MDTAFNNPRQRSDIREFQTHVPQDEAHEPEDYSAVHPTFSKQMIFVLGPSSSGKTTLCNALTEDLNLDQSRYIREVARNVMKTMGFTRADVDTYEMQYAIMTAQLRAEKDVLSKTKDSDGPLILLSDRSAIDPIVYTTTSQVPGASDRRRRLLEDMAFQDILPIYKRSLFGKYLDLNATTSVDIPRVEVILQPIEEWFHDDGVRSLEDPWEYNEQLYATMTELNIPFVTIGEERKDLRERVEFLKQFLQSERTLLHEIR